MNRLAALLTALLVTVAPVVLKADSAAVDFLRSTGKINQINDEQ